VKGAPGMPQIAPPSRLEQEPETGSHAMVRQLALRRFSLGSARVFSREEMRFAEDSPLEGDGFKLPVPGRETVKPPCDTGLSKTGADLSGNRRFESISLERRVACEPEDDITHSIRSSTPSQYELYPLEPAVPAPERRVRQIENPGRGAGVFAETSKGEKLDRPANV
jgi:hypothetical protein